MAKRKRVEHVRLQILCGESAEPPTKTLTLPVGVSDESIRETLIGHRFSGCVDIRCQDVEGNIDLWVSYGDGAGLVEIDDVLNEWGIIRYTNSKYNTTHILLRIMFTKETCGGIKNVTIPLGQEWETTEEVLRGHNFSGCVEIHTVDSEGTKELWTSYGDGAGLVSLDDLFVEISAIEVRN